MPTMQDVSVGRPGTHTELEGLPRPGRCLVMGILNVIPDSFSDGGPYADTRCAIDRGLGLGLAAQGAGIVDVGGESTRPGAHPVGLEEELARTVPVVRALARAGVCTSIDTMHAPVARAAVEAGARLVNDVSGGLADPAMVSPSQRQAFRTSPRPGVRRAARWTATPSTAMSSPTPSPNSACASGSWRTGESIRPVSSLIRESASPSGPSTTGRCWSTWDRSGD